jgi:hypothetical protein
VEKDKDVLDASEEQAELVSNELAITPDQASDSIPILNPPDLDFFNALMLQEGQGQEQEKRKPLTNFSIALLEQNKYLIKQLVAQNKHTINRLIAPPSIEICAACGIVDQKSGGSGGRSEEQKSGDEKNAKKSGEKENRGVAEKEEKQSRTLAWKVDTVIRRVLRIFSLVLLVVIAMQLGFILRGQGFEERNVRRTGFFGR